jgi:predicted PurR-regulated permease PerM
MNTAPPDSNSHTMPASPSWWQRLTLSQVALGTAIVALTILGLGLLLSLRYVFLLLFLGITVATALMPIMERLRSLGLRRDWAALAAFSALVIVLSLVVGTIGPFIVNQISMVMERLPAGYAGFRDWMLSSTSPLILTIGAQLPVDPFLAMPAVDNNALSTVSEGLTVQLAGVGVGLLSTILILLFSYYWLIYRGHAIQALALLVPLDRRTDAVELWQQIEQKIGAFVRGLFMMAITIGALAGIGFSLIGLPYALTVAVIAAILEAIPYVGPLITLALAGLIGLTVSPTMALMAVLVAMVIQFVEANVIVPRVMDRAVGVQPIVTLLAIGIFADLFGVLGALLAVPLAAAIQVLIDRLIHRNPADHQEAIGGRDQIAVLRYQARDLAGDLKQNARQEAAQDDDQDLEAELEAWIVNLDGMLARVQEKAL